MFDRDEPRLEAFRPIELPQPPAYVLNMLKEKGEEQKTDDAISQLVMPISKCTNINGVTKAIERLASAKTRPSIEVFNTAIAISIKVCRLQKFFLPQKVMSFAG